MEEEINERREKLSSLEIMEKTKRINKEYKRLKKLFKNLPKNKKELAENLLHNAAFMAISLDELKEDIKNYGVKEFYMNGKGQFGYKESVESKTYNVQMKNYMTIIKQLNDMMPQETKIDEGDEFDRFCDDA